MTTTRKQIKLSRAEKEGVTKWLNGTGDKNGCPFSNFGSTMCWGTIQDRGYRICKSWFPRVYNKKPCPCYTYKLSTVTHRAKEMIK